MGIHLCTLTATGHQIEEIGGGPVDTDHIGIAGSNLKPGKLISFSVGEDTKSLCATTISTKDKRGKRGHQVTLPGRFRGQEVNNQMKCTE
jgi:hypothetical protein